MATPPKPHAHSALLDNHPEHLKFIGLIAANWALMEGSLCRLICFMLGIDWPAARAILYTITSNRVRRDMIKNIATSQNYSEESLKNLDRALSKVKRVAKQRNDYMHYIYGVAAQGKIVQHLPNPIESRDERREVTIKQLETLAEEITNATRLLNALPHEFHTQYLEKKKSSQ